MHFFLQSKKSSCSFKNRFGSKDPVSVFQLTQAQTGKFNVHVHVEYEWRLQNEDLDESEDEMEDKVGRFPPMSSVSPVQVLVGDCVFCPRPAAHPEPARRATGQLLRPRQRPHADQSGSAGSRRCLGGTRQAETTHPEQHDQQRDVRHDDGPEPASAGADAPAAPQRSQQRSDRVR